MPDVTAFAEELRARIVEVTGGLTASVGIGTSKFIAKVASDLDKPDGLVVVPPGTEVELLRPMHVTVIPGVGPATAERLRKAGIHTVADLESVSIDELVRLVGKAHGTGLYALARADDDRPVVAERETKSVSVEGTYETDLTDRKLMEGLLTRQASEVAGRLRKHGLSGRTITIKVRLHDFTTLSRSTTLPSPTDSSDHRGPPRPRAARRPGHLRRGAAARRRRLRARRLDPGRPVRRDRAGGGPGDPRGRGARAVRRTTWAPGMDVVHDEMGRGWVWGSGRGVVTVRFETAETEPGPVRSYAADDPALHPWLPDIQVPGGGTPDGLACRSWTSGRSTSPTTRRCARRTRSTAAPSCSAARTLRTGASRTSSGAMRSTDSGERMESCVGFVDGALVSFGVIYLFLLDNTDKGLRRGPRRPGPPAPGLRPADARRT